MTAKDFRLIGRGIYSIREAHRLTGVPTRRIRRWARGYHFEYRGQRRFSPPAVATEIPDGIGSSAITFADLLEVRFLNAFRERGVSWPAIRIASKRAEEILGLSHPFSSRRFSTDGRTILAELVSETGDEILLDLVRNQYELRRIIDQYLHGEIDFGGHEEPVRWWPVRGSDRIVIDPHRALGAPIVNVEGVPTRILARAAEVEGSIEVAAALFDVDPESVAEAVEFELSHRA
jgi:uncharacterized protein (DUF433 family)/DNA-binding transcriptional MerR regulator